MRYTINLWEEMGLRVKVIRLLGGLYKGNRGRENDLNCKQTCAQIPFRLV